jgi:hypothetical protein
VVRESRQVEAADKRRVEAGQRQVAATLALEAGLPGLGVFEQQAAFRRFRKTQHWTR